MSLALLGQAGMQPVVLEALEYCQQADYTYGGNRLQKLSVRAIRTIGTLRMDAVPNLAALIDRNTPIINVNIAEALGRVGSDEAVRVLADMLDFDEQVESLTQSPLGRRFRVSDVAISALEQIDTPLAREALVHKYA